MPARDKIHQAVKTALEKDGWVITDDPLEVVYEGVELQVDLGAERLIGAEKGTQKIAVEIKSFLAASPVFEMHQVVGQFLNYEQALEETHPERKLYLAVPLDTYRIFFTQRYAQAIVRRRGLKIIVVSTETEVIVEWKN